MIKEDAIEGVVEHSQSLPVYPRLGDSFIRAREAFLNRLSGVEPCLAINSNLPQVDTGTPDNLASILRQTLIELKTSTMDDSGSQVDFAALGGSLAYAAYRETWLSRLRSFRPEDLPSLAARRAFWINLYNALLVDAVIAFGVRRSVTEGRLGLLTFFRRAAYLVGGQRVSLEDIEHGILRANRGNPYLPGSHFPATDPRLAWSLPLDPRLHFTLNCGSRSCPPIRAYSAEKLDAQLDLAARSFVASAVEVHPKRRELILSRIFQWYQRDFGGRGGVLDFLIRYLPDDERRQQLIDNGDRLAIRYAPYDWGLNSL